MVRGVDDLGPQAAADALGESGISAEVVRTASVTSVDFHLFPLSREGVTDNLVYRARGFVGGVIRLPRIPKESLAETGADEQTIIESRIHSALPFGNGIRLQLKPELEGLVEDFDDYWYPHVNIERELTAEDAVLIAKQLKQGYSPP